MSSDKCYSNEKVGVLFVCMGNICRSPTAEGVFTALAQALGMSHLLSIDSAGTHDYHVGNPPDERARQAALKRGIEIGHLRARQVTRADLVANDYILAMDGHNLNVLRRLGAHGLEHKIRLFLEFAPHTEFQEVPDPYFGGGEGFEVVLDLIEAASKGLLNEIRGRVTLGR